MGPPSHAPARTAAWTVSLLGLPCAAAVLAAAGMRLTWAGSAGLLCPLLLLAAAHAFYMRARPDPVVACATGVLVVLIGAALTAGIISHAGLRLHRPLVDMALAGWDRALGIDTPMLVLATAAHPPLGRLLGIAYGSTFPAVFAMAVWLALRRDACGAWEVAFCFAAGIIVAALISVAWPALGNVASGGLDPAALRGLPAGSGVYFLDAFAYYRDGSDPVLAFDRLDGVVAFPSFHAMMALIVGRALGRIPGWRSAGAIYAAVVIASAVPIGGHYVVDLAGGALLWAACLWPLRAPAGQRNTFSRLSYWPRLGAPGTS